MNIAPRISDRYTSVMKILDRLIHAASPMRWTRPFRRLFVILTPVSVPLLICFWVFVIVAFVAMMAMGCIGLLLMEAFNGLRALWN